MILLQLCIYTLSLQLPFTFYIYSKQTNKHKAKFCFSLFFISSGVIIVDLDFKLPSDLVPFWICFGYSHTVATSTLPTLTWFPPLFFSTVVLYETKGQQARQKWCAQPATFTLRLRMALVWASSMLSRGGAWVLARRKPQTGPASRPIQTRHSSPWARGGLRRHGGL